MLLYRLQYLPDGSLNASQTNLDDLDPGVVAPFQAMFAKGLSFDGPVPDAANSVVVKWTGTIAGQALMSCFYDRNLYLSGVVAAGLDPAADREVLEQFTASMEKIPIVQQMTGSRPTPFAMFLERPERPLLAVVVWPIMSAEIYEQIGGVDILLTAAFLRRLGLGSKKGT